MRFAFYGRVSTEDQQDPQASKAWQLSRARSLIEPAGGEIVAEFFDIGLSRSLPWKLRPKALRLLATIKSSARDFEAVVMGESQRRVHCTRRLTHQRYAVSLLTDGPLESRRRVFHQLAESRPASFRHQAADSSGSSQAENGTGRFPCLRRLNRSSSSAAATTRPSTTTAAAGS
jgi:hypothetical protein